MPRDNRPNVSRTQSAAQPINTQGTELPVQPSAQLSAASPGPPEWVGKIALQQWKPEENPTVEGLARQLALLVKQAGGIREDTVHDIVCPIIQGTRKLIVSARDSPDLISSNLERMYRKFASMILKALVDEVGKDPTFRPTQHALEMLQSSLKKAAREEADDIIRQIGEEYSNMIGFNPDVAWAAARLECNVGDFDSDSSEQEERFHR